VRPPRRRAVTAALGAVVVAAAIVLVTAAGCALEPDAGEDEPALREARALAEGRAAFADAAQALLAGDRERFLASAPATDGTHDGLAEVFDTLAPLPWDSFAFDVTPLDPGAGLFRVRGAGRLGPAGPPDRVAVERHLVLEAGAGDVRVVADRTPAGLRDRYLMALHDPIVLRRPGLLVLGDGGARNRAAAVLAAAARARHRLARLGIGDGSTVVITVFGSAEEARAALGLEASGVRLVFFAYPAPRIAEEPWPIRDVGVMGPWLHDTGEAMSSVLAHELAHAFTIRWFAGTAHTPVLLVEGIAQTAEGAPAGHLRDEVATGNQLWPLPESFASEDIWAGNTREQAALGYEVGGSLVGYVLSRWGTSKLRPFAQAVADEEPTEAGADRAVRKSLGVSWRGFYAGWKRYVLSGS